MLNNLRNSLQPILEKVGKLFASTGLSPNFWTVLGLLFAILAAIIYGLNIEFGLIFGGLLLLVSGFFDVVDGQVARVTGKTSKTGSYLDSMFDKIAEVAIFFGILLAGYAQPSAVMLAITLSLLVSYARAKSDALNIKMQGIGIGERAERLLVIAILGIIGFIEYAVIIVVIISGITLIQRMILTIKSIKEKSN
jgi:archaetidylinositol phosphate synthase